MAGRSTRVTEPEDRSFLPSRIARAADQAAEAVLEEDAIRRALNRPLASR